MRRRFPSSITYAPTTLALVASIILSGWREWFLAQPEWVEWLNRHLPMSDIILFSAALLVGLFVQDSLNRKSWLRERWRHLTRRFELITVQTVHHDYTNEPRHRVDLNAHLKFTRRVRGGRLMLRVFTYGGMEYPFDLETRLDKERGDFMTVCLYRLRIARPGEEYWEDGWAPDYLGDGRSKRQPVIDGVVAVLELEAGWPTQRNRIFVKRIDYRDGKPAKAMFALDEDWEIFDVSERHD